MTDSKMVLSEESWKNLTPENRDWIIYNTLNDLDDRVKIIERRKIINTSITFVGGVFGGVIGFFSSKFFHGN